MSVITWVQDGVKKIEADFVSAETEVEKVILPAVIEITNIAKTIVLTDTTDIIGTLVAGKYGAAVEDKARAVLPEFYAELQLGKAFLASNPSTDTIIYDVTKAGLELTGDTRASYLIEFSSKLAVALSDKKLTVQQGVILTQAFYAEEKGIATQEQTDELTPTEPAVVNPAQDAEVPAEAPETPSEANERPIEGKVQEEATGE